MVTRVLSPDLQAVAKNELNEDPSTIAVKLKEIQGWLGTQQHLNVRPDDQWLLGFLRGCKYDLEKTKRKIDMLYTMKTLVPELYADRNPYSKKIQDMLKLGLCFPLPKSLGPSSQPVVITRHTDADINKIHVMDLIKIMFMTIEILMNEHDNFIILGSQMVFDLADLPLNHMLQMTPYNTQKAINCFQSGYPIRPQKLNMLNAPYFFEPLFKLIKPFLSKKLRSRICMYNAKNMSELYDHIPREVLPEEYGGDDGPMDKMAEEWKKKIESYSDWFLEEALYGSDESKRPHKISFAWSLWNRLFKN